MFDILYIVYDIANMLSTQNVRYLKLFLHKGVHIGYDVFEEVYELLSYAPLLSTLHDRGKALNDLRKDLGLSPSTIAKFKKNEHVSLDVVDRICEFLDCEIHDVVKRKKDAPTA